VEKDKRPYVTVYRPVAGYKAVLMSWEEDLGMHTPWNTGMFAYRTREEAVAEAKGWAEAEEIEYRD